MTWRLVTHVVGAYSHQPCQVCMRAALKFGPRIAVSTATHTRIAPTGERLYSCEAHRGVSR